MKATCPVCQRETSLTPKGGRFVRHFGPTKCGSSVCPGTGQEPGEVIDLDVTPVTDSVGRRVTEYDAERVAEATLAKVYPDPLGPECRTSAVRPSRGSTESRPILTPESDTLAPVYALPIGKALGPAKRPGNGQRWQPVSVKRGKRARRKAGPLKSTNSVGETRRASR